MSDESAGDRRLRLFAAVDVPRHVRLGVEAAAEPLRSAAKSARWADPASWHLTLAFLGWVPDDHLPQVSAALEAVAAEVSPFTLALDGRAGTFGRRVLWTGLEPSPELQRLAARTQEALAPLGVPIDDRPFHPHLTLARARRDGSLPLAIERQYRGPRSQWRVDHLDLMRSELRRSGAWYTPVASWRLGAGGGGGGI